MYWTMSTMEEAHNIKKVLKVKDVLYLLKINKIEKITDNFVIKNYVEFDKLGSTHFIDVAYDDNKLYVLDR